MSYEWYKFIFPIALLAYAVFVVGLEWWSSGWAKRFSKKARKNWDDPTKCVKDKEDVARWEGNAHMTAQAYVNAGALAKPSVKTLYTPQGSE